MISPSSVFFFSSSSAVVAGAGLGLAWPLVWLFVNGVFEVGREDPGAVECVGVLPPGDSGMRRVPPGVVGTSTAHPAGMDECEVRACTLRRPRGSLRCAARRRTDPGIKRQQSWWYHMQRSHLVLRQSRDRSELPCSMSEAALAPAHPLRCAAVHSFGETSHPDLCGRASRRAFLMTWWSATRCGQRRLYRD